MTKYIISLTVIPSKFDYLYLSIDSIINQTYKPEKIIINIPDKYNFRFNDKISQNKIDTLKKKYNNKNIIINILDKDYGPGTKLLGLFHNNIIEEYDLNDDIFIVLVDDDLIYKPYMIEYFNNFTKNNNVDVASYYVYNKGIQIGQGADGFFIRLKLLNKFLKFYDIIKNEDYLGYHDDFYISYYFYLMKINIFYIKPPNNSLIYDKHNNATVDALSLLKNKYSRGNLNVQCLRILNNLFKNINF